MIDCNKLNEMSKECYALAHDASEMELNLISADLTNAALRIDEIFYAVTTGEVKNATKNP